MESQSFQGSGIVRLQLLTKEIYVVSGSEYVNAVWKNTKGFDATVGLNLACRECSKRLRQI